MVMNALFCLGWGCIAVFTLTLVVGVPTILVRGTHHHRTDGLFNFLTVVFYIGFFCIIAATGLRAFSMPPAPDVAPPDAAIQGRPVDVGR